MADLSSRKFGVLIHGQNFLIDMDGQVAKRGFYTWRYVEAIDPDTAVQKAVAAFREEPELRNTVQNTEDDRPFLDVDQLTELEPAADLPPSTGFIWYPMRSKRWWQFWQK